MSSREGASCRPSLGDPAAVLRTVFGCDREEIAPTAILSPFIPLKAFRRHFTEELAHLAPPFFYKGVTGTVGTSPVTVVLTGVGPSRVGDCVGFLALAGVERLLFVGAVGALDPACGIGDLFAPTVVADGEGFSRYTREGFPGLVATAHQLHVPPDPFQGLEGLAAERGLVLRRGRVFTIGSIAFETEAHLRALREAGYAAVEMELSAFYAAAACYGLEAGCVTYVSDQPLGSSLWREKTPEEEAALRHAYRAAPELALRLAGQRLTP